MGENTAGVYISDPHFRLRRQRKPTRLQTAFWRDIHALARKSSLQFTRAVDRLQRHATRVSARDQSGHARATVDRLKTGNVIALAQRIEQAADDLVVGMEVRNLVFYNGINDLQFIKGGR